MHENGKKPPIRTTGGAGDAGEGAKAEVDKSRSGECLCRGGCLGESPQSEPGGGKNGQSRT